MSALLRPGPAKIFTALAMTSAASLYSGDPLAKAITVLGILLFVGMAVQAMRDLQKLAEELI